MSSCRASVLAAPDSPPVPYEPFSYPATTRVPTISTDGVRMTHRLPILAGTVAVALAAATVALAGHLPPTAPSTGTAGVPLSLPSSLSISTTLDGSDKVVTWSALLGVVDARGSGAGWNLTVSATDFTSGSHTLAPGTISGVAAACHGGNACTAATNSVTYPITLGTTAAKFFSSALDSGLGKIDVTPSVDVSIPGNAYAGTYTSTVT